MDIVARLRMWAAWDYMTESASADLFVAADEIERLREQESKMTTHALVQMEEIERLREVVMLLVAYDEHDEDIQKGAVMWDVLIEAAHAALKENE